MTQNKVVQPGIERHREERKEQAGNWRGKSVEKRGETGDILTIDRVDVLN
jgi:hypothetical protein